MSSISPCNVPLGSERTAWRCRWLFTGEGEPIADGVIEIEAGRITAIHNRPGGNAVDLGNVAILPGLVNAHTHLEFSALAEPITPALPFTSWICKVIADRRARRGNAPEAAESSAMTAGIVESQAAGVRTIGEIATSDVWEHPADVLEAADSLRESSLLAERADYPPAGGPRVVAFREIIGQMPERFEEQLAVARRHLEASPNPHVIRGLSPHAPYSVHFDLLRQLVDLSIAAHAPVAMHLAETEAELELLTHGTGEFRRMLEDFGLWREGLFAAGHRPLDFLNELSRSERALIVHGNYLSDDELDFVAGCSHLTVVYCPRTHAYFGHREHPWLRLLARGANVALGTDSRASNPDLSLWSEVRFLQARFPRIEPRVLLELATRNGARALGLAETTGTLTPGKRADLAVIELPDRDGDPWSLLFHRKSRISPDLNREL